MAYPYDSERFQAHPKDPPSSTCGNVRRVPEAPFGLRLSTQRGPVLRAALAAHQFKYVTQRVEHDADAA